MEWRVRGEGRFYDAGEQSVVYFDAASGDTHLVSDLAAALIAALGAGPLTREALLARISADYPEEDPALLEGAVTATLDELATLGVLVRQG